MPYPKKGESKKKFIKRCIPYLWNEEPDTLTAKTKGKKSKQSYAICNSLYKKHHIKEFYEFIQESDEYEYKYESGKRDYKNPLINEIKQDLQKIYPKVDIMDRLWVDINNGYEQFPNGVLSIDLDNVPESWVMEFIEDCKKLSRTKKYKDRIKFLDDPFSMDEELQFEILNKPEDSNMEEWVEESYEKELESSIERYEKGEKFHTKSGINGIGLGDEIEYRGCKLRVGDKVKYVYKALSVNGMVLGEYYKILDFATIGSRDNVCIKVERSDRTSSSWDGNTHPSYFGGSNGERITFLVIGYFDYKHPIRGNDVEDSNFEEWVEEN